MLHNLATQKQSATLQCVACDKNFNLNRVFGHSELLSVQLNGPLTNYTSNYQSDQMQYKEMK